MMEDGGNCVQVVERGLKEKGNLANVWDPIYVLTYNVVSLHLKVLQAKLISRGERWWLHMQKLWILCKKGILWGVESFGI